MARLLVTGGAGFIGSNFVRYWRRAHPADAIVVYDLLTYAGHLPSIADLLSGPDVSFVQGDIRDGDRVYALLRDQRLDTIVHFAAESHVDRSITGPQAFVDTNVVGTHALLMAARRAWLDEGRNGPGQRFHHVSTDEVYGSLAPGAPPFTELTPCAPNSPYAASKAAADFLVRAYHRTYGLPATVTNCSNNYGPYQYPEKLIPLFILNCLRGLPLPVYGDGLNVRDWLHVADHCRAIDLVLRQGRTGETWNIGGDNELPNLAIVDRLCALVDAEMAASPALRARFPACPAARGGSTTSLRTFVPDRPGHDRRYAIDMGKARAGLGFSPSLDFDAGLRQTLRWYLDNEAWWRGLLGRQGAG